MTTQAKSEKLGGFNINSIIISVGTFIILAALGWVGHTASTTHDSVIRLEVKQTATELSISEIKEKMLTRTDLSVELLKLQVPENKIPKSTSAK